MLRVGVGGKVIHRHDARQAVLVLHVVDVPLQVCDARLQRVEVFLVDLLEVAAAVVLERADGRDDHHRRGTQPRFPALDVDELLRPEVGAEARLRHDVIGELERRLGGEDRITAVSDVGERSTVDECGIVLERLHEIRLQRLLEQHRHGALCLQVTRTDGREVALVAHHDVAEPGFEVFEVGRQAENRHDLGGHHDVEAILAREAIAGTAEADGDVAQGAIVHVQHALPSNAPNVETEFIAMIDMVVDERREQIVGERNRVEIAREV